MYFIMFDLLYLHWDRPIILKNAKVSKSVFGELLVSGKEVKIEMVPERNYIS